MSYANQSIPDELGHFGIYGGSFVPETLMVALSELKTKYLSLKDDPDFQSRIIHYLHTYAGRPTAMYMASNLSAHAGGAKIYLKREDLAHTGAHKINNALGQAMVAKAMGKTRVIAETGAGQHGVATATACAVLGLQCLVYMGQEDINRQTMNVYRMQLLGAEVIPVSSGSRTLKDAINEAIRDWVTNVDSTYYLIGSAVGPHPYPMIVRDFQRVIGVEAKQQMLEIENRLPTHLVACVGGGSNAIGLFHPFIEDLSVKLIGVEAAGTGLASGQHAATLVAGRPGVLHGSRAYLLQDKHGQIKETHSISAGLDYPGVGPEHSYLKDIKRAEYVSVTDDKALEAFHLLSKTEGIIPALESAHAISYAVNLAQTLSPREIILVCLSGRGDKDVETVSKLSNNVQPD